jgi:NADH-quinone oxidoreductase subunit J
MVVLVFYAAVVVGVVSAVVAVSHRNPVVNVLSLVVTLFCVAVSYALLGAEFLAAAQILIYAGAILVLFLFVVMLLNLRSDAFAVPRSRLVKLLGMVVTGWILWVFVRLLPGSLPAVKALPEGFGGFRDVGRELFTSFVLPFEVTSFLLLAAIVGAVVLAKRRID